MKAHNHSNAAYLTSLAARPLLTKASTAGVLSFLSEILAGHISKTAPAPLSAKDRTGIPPVDFLKQNTKAVQLAAYGFFISAPLGHTLLNILQKVFEGKTSARAKLLMILVSNICISPIQQSVYIAAMAYIGGARTSQQMMRAWSMSFWPVMRLTWVISTLAMATAQKFLPMEQWVPFFTAIGAVAGCALNVAAKKRMAIAGAAAAKAKRDAEKKE